MVLWLCYSIKIAVGALTIHKRHGATLETSFAKRRPTSDMVISEINKTQYSNHKLLCQVGVPLL